MQYWLMKTEPGAYSWNDLVKDKKTLWDGVRNYQARNNMKAMKKGDQVFIYHSVSDKEVVGIAEVIKEHYPDPTADSDKWVVVDIKPLKALKKKVSLAEIKATPALSGIALVRQSRLSVVPLKKVEFDKILSMGA